MSKITFNLVDYTMDIQNIATKLKVILLITNPPYSI